MPRLNLDVTPKMDELLTQLAKEKSTSKADVLRRAIALYNYVDAQLAEGGKTTALAIAKDNQVVKEIVLP